MLGAIVPAFSTWIRAFVNLPMAGFGALFSCCTDASHHQDPETQAGAPFWGTRLREKHLW